MKIELFVAREIQYFEFGVFSFNSYVFYLTRDFIASTRAFNLPIRAFNLPTRAFDLATRAFSLASRAFSLLTRGFELVTRAFEIVTREFELVTRGFELVTRGFELVTRNSYFTFPREGHVKKTLLSNCRSASQFFFFKFSTQDILIPHPPFIIKFGKMFQPGHI